MPQIEEDEEEEEKQKEVTDENKRSKAKTKTKMRRTFAKNWNLPHRTVKPAQLRRFLENHSGAPPIDQVQAGRGPSATSRAGAGQLEEANYYLCIA